MKSGKWKLIILATSMLSLPLTTLVSPGAQAAGPEEIVVTARRKEESLQEIPLAVNAIGAAEIEIRGIKQLNDIVKLDPSVLVDQGFSAEDTRITVRGISNTRGRSNVAFLVDGVDVTSESLSTAGSSLLVSQRLLGDVERIEIVKGPQSALYGRSAFAGAISYITKNANLEEMEGDVRAELSDYDRYEVSGGVSGPVIPGVLGFRIEGVKWDGDAYYDNDASGRDLGGPNGWGSSVTMNFEPNDEFRLKWRMSYSDNENGTQPQTVYRPKDMVEVPLPDSALQSNGGPIRNDKVVLSVPSYGSSRGRKVKFSEDPTTNNEYLGSSADIFRTSLKMDWDIGPGTFTSISGYTDADTLIAQDIDYQGQGFPDQIGNNWEIDTTNTTKQLSQELRYATAFDGAVNFTVGGLGWYERRDQDSRGYIALCSFFNDPDAGTEPCVSGNWQDLVRAEDIRYGDNGFTNAKTTHWSVYGMIDWDVTDRLTASVETRYVNEDFELDRSLGTPCQLSPFSGCSNIDAVSGSVRSDFIVPKFTLDYAVTDDVNVYASAGKGQKPGGITTIASGAIVPIESLSFDSEKLWSYEAGWKTSFDSKLGRVVLNGAVFYQDYTDKQVSVIKRTPFPNPLPPPEFTVTTVAAVENASSADILGQEVQVVYMPPLEGLTLNISYTHLDTEYKNYTSDTQVAQTIAELGNCTQKTIADEVFCTVDYSGNSLEKSPDHSIVSTISLIRPLLGSNFDYLAEFDANYQSDRYASASNFSELESYWLMNLRLGVQADQWSVIAFADNLFDDDTIVSGGTVAPDFGAGFVIPPILQRSSQLTIPRLVGVRANFSF